MSRADKLLKESFEYLDLLTFTMPPEEHPTIHAHMEDIRTYLNRRRKLVVGSQWVCDVDECVGGFITHYKDEVCNVTKVFDDSVYIQRSINHEEDEIPTEQFLACFVPKEDIK